MSVLILIIFYGLSWFLFFRKSPHNLVLLYIVLLPFQDFLIMLSTNMTFLPRSFFLLLMGWKEALLALTIGWLLLTRKRPTLLFIDKLILIYILYTVVYATLPNSFFPSPLTPTQRMMGVRMSLVPIFLYVLGRYIIVNEMQIKRLVKKLIIITVVVSGFGVFETLLIPRETYTNTLNSLGRVRLETLRVPPKRAQDIEYEVLQHDQAYIRTIMGMQVPRLISFYMKPLTPAYASIFIVLIMGYIIISGSGKVFTKYPRWLFLLFALAMIMTMTRAVIFITMLMLLFIMRKEKSFKGIQLILIMIIPMIAGFSLVADFVSSTITLEEPSVVNHLLAYVQGLETLKANPLGVGLGQGGPVAQAILGKVAAGESLYLTLAVERGIQGLVLFLLVCIALVFTLKKGFKVIKTPISKAILSATYFSTFVFLITSITTETWFGFKDAGIYWIFAGFSAQLIANSHQQPPRVMVR